MNKILQILEFIEHEGKTGNEIREFCRTIGIDPQHAWDIMTEERAPLIKQQIAQIEGLPAIVKYRPTLNGYYLLTEERKKRKHEKHSLTRTLGTLGIVAALVAFVLIAYNYTLPNVLGPEYTCPLLLSRENTLNVSFENYGLTPTSIKYDWNGQNMRALSTSDGEIEYQPSFSFTYAYVPVVMRDANNGFTLKMNVDNITKDASFSLIGKENNLFRTNHINLNCEYKQISNVNGILGLASMVERR
jgi:hypothetical protein